MKKKDINKLNLPPILALIFEHFIFIIILDIYSFQEKPVQVFQNGFEK